MLLLHLAAGGTACNPVRTGICAVPGHHEQRKPSTRLPTDASGWRSSARMSIARFVRQPGQYTSSHGVLATMAHRIVGDHSGDRSAFQWVTISSAALRAASPVAHGASSIRYQKLVPRLKRHLRSPFRIYPWSNLPHVRPMSSGPTC
jgi:hypothetical protein